MTRADDSVPVLPLNDDGPQFGAQLKTLGSDLSMSSRETLLGSVPEDASLRGQVRSPGRLLDSDGPAARALDTVAETLLARSAAAEEAA